jgi:hypothetical protein
MALRQLSPGPGFGRRIWSLALLTAAALQVTFAPATGVRAMDSPWWENYDQKDRYSCTGNGVLVVERNDSQASLINGRGRLILFREDSDRPGLLYRNEDIRILLQGDELTLERLPMRIVCLRTQQA